MTNTGASGKTVGSIVGTILTFIGLPSIPDDLGKWGVIVQWVQSRVPWWVLVLVGLTTLAITWVPAVSKKRAFRYLKERLSLATPLGAGIRARREKLRMHVVNLGFPAAEHAKSLLQIFINKLMYDPDPLKSWIPGLVQGHVLDNYAAAASKMLDPFRLPHEGRNKSFYTESEFMDLFDNYWIRYTGLVGALKQADRIRPDLISQNHVYALWKKADEDFVEAMRRLTVEPGFDEIAKRIKSRGWGDQLRQ